MSSNLINLQSQKENNNKQSQTQHQQQQQQLLQAQIGLSSNVGNNQIVIQTVDGQQNIFSSHNQAVPSTQSHLITSSNQNQRKISQKVQIKVSNTQQSSTMMSQLQNQHILNQTNSHQVSNLPTFTISQQQSQQQPSLLSQQSIQQQQQLQTQIQSSSSTNSSYSLQSQFSSQNSFYNCCSPQVNPIAQNQSHEQVSLQNQQLMNINQASTTSNISQNVVGCNGSGLNGGQKSSISAANSMNTTMVMRKGQGITNDDNGIYSTQKKKLLQIIQKQQREQQEFEKQKLQVISIGVTSSSSSVVISQTTEEILQEIAKTHKISQSSMKPVQVITSPKTKNQNIFIRNLLKKQKRNLVREENFTGSNITLNQVNISTQQIKSQNITQVCNSPLIRPTNGLIKDEKFQKHCNINKSITHLIQQQSDDDKKLKEPNTRLAMQELDQVGENLQSQFDKFNQILTEDDQAFLRDIEEVCNYQSQHSTISDKLLYNKKLQQQITSQQFNSQGIQSQNISSSMGQHENILSQYSKENDCTKVKEGNFKRTVKSIPFEKPVISQLVHLFDSSFDKKNNNNNNSEFFYNLETDDSLATTHLSALSNCTPLSISQNLLNLFSPLNNSDSSSTISFNNTNNSLKQALESFNLQNGESNTLIYEQIKCQFDTHKQQQQQSQQSLNQKDKQSVMRNKAQEVQMLMQKECVKNINLNGQGVGKGLKQPLIFNPN